MSLGKHRRARVHIGVAGGAVAVMLLVGGCGSGTDESASPSTTASATSTTAPATAAQPATVTVEVDDMKFSPADVSIRVGGTVTWKFSDRFPHAVQGIGDAAMGINSPITENGEWSHTFTVPGTYRYLCPLHPEMRGTVTVQ
ncbi:plastocyanin/azurin family copper-binding protein [Nocardia transvalensis]|uniref:plastocyanin/azurin family copper-binding protein n=1 Tax=Nocardia transvalensis TaxID=37333 RepID=UPI0018955993|nr:plastocyanin/azurin family copper-binding protein [Nocardia transvalensis]MBF6327440.1 cupredoxin domain-containing protein [Nocardia transvalensis]